MVGSPVQASVEITDRRLVTAAAALSFSAALIHFSVAPAHFREYWGFGVFFVVVAALQLGWAELARRYGPDARPLLVGLVGNLAVAALWLASRTVGLPVGPEAGQAEGLGLHDVLATLDELGIAALCALLLTSRGRRAAPEWVAIPALALAAISFVGAFLGSHSGT